MDLTDNFPGGPGDLACSQCFHLHENHVFLTFDVKDGGVIVCPAADCICVKTWAPSWDGGETLPPDYETVVNLVRTWAQNNDWSEDRLIDSLAHFERRRRKDVDA